MKFFDNNPRKITKKQFKQLSADLEEFGDLGGIVHDLNSDQVISGNQRCRALDLSRVQPIITERFDPPTRAGTVAIGYVEWRGERFSYRSVQWTPEQCLAANIKANLDGGNWDFDILANWDADLLQGIGFDNNLLKDWQEQSIALGEMLAAEEGGDEGKDTEPQISKADELQQVWQVQLGDLWQCGEHRIICGDCTDRAVVEKVMGRKLADLVFTDPPYNVDYGSNQAPIWGKSVKTITNDNLSDDDWIKFQDKWMESLFFNISEAAIYICMSAKEWATTRTSFVKNGGHWSSDIIWVKSQLVPGRKNYHSRYEALLYGWAEGKHHYWCGDTTQDDIWEIRRNSTNELHPTQKPVELIKRAINNSCVDNGIVYDPFLGSGTTMIAAHQLGRRCFGIEIEPSYVAVCLDRFKRHTGIEPTRLASAQP